MAYRVAELIKRAETSIDPSIKESAERECQDLIIRLWETRDNWPTGGPLHPLLPTLKVLLTDTPAYYRWMRLAANDDASGLITRLLRLQRDELQQIYQLIKDRVPADIIESMQQLLDEHRADLSEEENSLISFVIHPTEIPLFDSEEATAGYDEEKVEEKIEVSVDSKTTLIDNFTNFRNSIESERMEFFKAVAHVLTDNSSSTSN